MASAIKDLTLRVAFENFAKIAEASAGCTRRIT